MIIERTTYRPKPGQFEAVLATRRKASRRRREIGLPGGTIFTGESEAGRVVFWECAFADGAAQQRDLAARGADRGFAEIRDAMVRLLESFDRCVLGADDDRQASLLVPQDLADHPVAPRTLRFRSGGEELVGYLYLPPGKGPFPCMVTNHGSGVTQVRDLGRGLSLSRIQCGERRGGAKKSAPRALRRPLKGKRRLNARDALSRAA